MQRRNVRERDGRRKAMMVRFQELQCWSRRGDESAHAMVEVSTWQKETSRNAAALVSRSYLDKYAPMTEGQ